MWLVVDSDRSWPMAGMVAREVCYLYNLSTRLVGKSEPTRSSSGRWGRSGSGPGSLGPPLGAARQGSVRPGVPLLMMRLTDCCHHIPSQGVSSLAEPSGETGRGETRRDPVTSAGGCSSLQPMRGSRDSRGPNLIGSAGDRLCGQWRMARRRRSLVRLPASVGDLFTSGCELYVRGVVLHTQA